MPKVQFAKQHTHQSFVGRSAETVVLLARSRLLSPTSPLPSSLQRRFSFDRRHWALVRDYEVISHSPLFDRDWYVDTYENVAENGEDPIHHFLKFGCEYALSPGPCFDTKSYFVEHPQVQELGENPLLHFIRSNGGASPRRSLLESLSHVWRRIRGTDEGVVKDPYAAWIEEYEADGGWAAGQTGPSISFLVVAPIGASAALHDTLSSLAALRGRDWQVLVPAGALASDAAPAFRATQVPVDFATRGSVLSKLFAAATGDFIAVLDAGDRVSPHALQEFWQCLRDRPELDIVYGDEDVVSARGREKPFLKPDWSPEYLESFNYLGRSTCIRRSVALRAGGFVDDCDDAAEYDLNLRVCDATQNVGRIPRILCHRSPETAALRPAVDSAAMADQQRVLVARWARLGRRARVTPQPDGTLRSTWPLVEPPLVSVVIANDSRSGRLDVTLQGLLHRTDYPNLEIVVVDGPSNGTSLAALGAEIEPRSAVRIVSFTEPFNRSAACNSGARAANGSMLLFLSNAVDVTAPDWLEELVRCTERPGVGIAGAILVSPDGELRHAGEVIGLGDGRGSLFQRAPLDDWGVFGSPFVPRNCLSVAHHCQLVRRDVFEMVGGFDETYQTSDSDIAFSLAARRAGYRTVCSPSARLVLQDDVSRASPMANEGCARLMRDLDAFGIFEDPFFHPALSARATVPTLCVHPDVPAAHNLAKRRAECLSTYERSSQIDLFDTAEVILALGRDDAREAFWHPQTASTISDVWSAMRFVIDLIRRDGDLRRRFPHALSEGGDGAFALWLMRGDGRTRFALSTQAIEAIGTAFAGIESDLVRRVFLFQDEIRTSMPLGCTPAGLGDLFAWLMRVGRLDHGLRIEAIWWFVIECVERPAQELVWTYLFNPEWQRMFPDGLTVFSKGRFARWLEVMYQVRGDWLAPERWPVDLSPAEQIRAAYHCREAWQQLHPKALASQTEALDLLVWLDSDDAGLDDECRTWLQALDTTRVAADLARTGANVLGHFRYPSGLRTSTESIVAGLQRAGAGTSLRDIWVEAWKDDPHHVLFSGLESFDVTIIHVQPEPLFSVSYQRAGLFERWPRTYRIAFWYWELDEVPATWAEKDDEIDEIWVATRFVADAVRARFDKPVHQFLPGLEIPPFDRLPRSHFGLADERFVFLFLFHMTSVMDRKNPLGLIRAFRAAFGDRPEPCLVLKTSFGSQHSDNLREMREAAAGEGITIIDAIYSPNETLSIMSACDCYVSLHRSEGYGLTMAEAMLLEKPVIATAYSGNLDFMDETNSLLVERDIVTLETDREPYAAGSRWAEPSVDHAAACMRRVFENPAWAKSVGARAKADLSTRLSHVACGERMVKRLEEIRRMRRET